MDAATGFAHSAIDMGFEVLIPLARSQGLALMSVRNSYNCGVLGYHTDRLARAGLLGLGFTNAPASIAPSGGSIPIVGTNPFSMAVPGPGWRTGDPDRPERQHHRQERGDEARPRGEADPRRLGP